MSQYRPPKNFELAGQRFELVMDDGREYELCFIDKDTLSFGRTDGEKELFDFDCGKPDDVTYFVIFEINARSPRTGVTLVLDTEQSLVTANFCVMGLNPRYPKLPKSHIVFGAIRRPDGTLPAIRHGYTRDLVGRSVHWIYGNRQEMIHIYSSERYYRLKLPESSRKLLMQTKPQMLAERDRHDAERLYEEQCDYIKIKDNMYVVSVDEYLICTERGSGNNLCFCIDLNRMYNVGRSFGHGGDGKPENYIYGAIGVYSDVPEVHQRKSTQYLR
jgi:hypothetical protein